MHTLAYWKKVALKISNARKLNFGGLSGVKLSLKAVRKGKNEVSPGTIQSGTMNPVVFVTQVLGG